MKKLVAIVFGVILGLTMTYDASASHLAGGSIRYDYVGPTPGSTTLWRYKITVSMMRDCRGITFNCGTTPSQLYGVCTSSGAQIGPILLTAVPYVPKPGERTNARGAKDVSDICSGTQSRCQGNNQALSGYEVYFFEATVDLPRCNSWRLTYQTCTCCRNPIQNFTGGGNVALETFINTSWSPRGNPGGAPANSAPQFADEAKPFPSACVGQNVFYGIGTYDADGDSLRFEATCPWATNTSVGRPNLAAMNPRNGATCARAIPGVFIDPATGLISFRAQTQGAWVVAFYVSEYERCTGILKGKTYREIQFRVEQCNGNNNIPIDRSGISNIQGKATLLSTYKMEVCNGELLSWDDTLFDADANDTILVQSNLQQVLPNASMAIIPTGQKNVVVARFTWRAVMGIDPIKSFFISFTDNKCQVPGSGFSVFELEVKPSATLGEDIYVCKGDTAFIQGYGSNTFRWRSLSGTPINDGVNWFPDTNIGFDTNKFVKFLPTQTTSLIIEVANVRDLCGAEVLGCDTVDTIKIYVPESFQISLPNDTILCNPGEGQLDVNSTKPLLGYSYKWTPSKNLNNDTIKTPRFSNLLVKTNFQVTVTSDSGCVREGSTVVDVSNPFPQNMSAVASDTLICLQDNIDLWVNTGSVNYGSCDTAIYPCIGSTVDRIYGSGNVRNTTTGTNTPTIYSGRNRSVRAQFLYTAADLNARGIFAGPINSIAFEIDVLAFSGANPFNAFSIRMGCSSSQQIGSAFVDGLRTVFDAKTVFPVQGWNDHVFDRSYVWDGVSNLLVDICWDNGSNTVGSDEIMRFNTTTYPASIRYYSTTANDACQARTPTTNPMSLLPKTKFGICSGVSSSNYNFNWISDPLTTGGFTTPTNRDSVSASVNLTTAKKYTVLVSDTSNVCFDTLPLTINVVSKYNVTPDTLPLQCVTSGLIRLTSPTPPNISTPGGKWVGTGIIDDTLGLWDPTVSGAGSFPVTYTVSGDACANSGSMTLNIAGLPDPGLTNPNEICVLYGDDTRHRLVPKIPGGWFSGFGVDSAFVGFPPVKHYFVDGTKFSPTLALPDTAYVKYQVFLGCLHDSITKIPVIAPFDVSYTGVLSNGVPIMTTEFCSTGTPDTLSGDGVGGVWRVVSPSNPNNSRAMIDSVRGVFNPRAINDGAGTTGANKLYIEIGKEGFCGDTGRYEITVFSPPQVEILAKDFCFSEPGDCSASEIRPADRKKTIFVRVANFPNKVIDPSNANSYVDVVTATTANSGWPSLIESDLQTKWDGTPWLIFPYKAEFPFCTLDEGRYPLSYTMAHRYRSTTNHPDSICSFTFDTAIYISKTPDAPLVTEDEYKLCAGDSLPNLRFADYDPNLTLEWYEDGVELEKENAIATGNPITSDADFESFIPSANGEVFARLRDAKGCLSQAEKVEYEVYGYPKVTFDRSVDTIRVGEEVTYENTTKYDELPMTFQWVYGSVDQDLLGFDIIGFNDSTISNSYSLPSADYNPLVRKGETFGVELVRLVGTNEIGCADSTQYVLYIDQIVEPKFPNVFTPNGDGINDWWSAISPSECCDYNEDLLKEAYLNQFLEISGYIYDRWGRKVQELSLENPFWKGDNKSGNEQPDGIYMFTIEMKIKSASEEVFEEQGTITLIRGK